MKELETRITEFLNEMEIPYHYKGFHNLHSAIALAVCDKDILGAVTKELYPAVADINGTTSFGVERSIRNAIDLSWDPDNRNPRGKLYRYTYSSCKGRPTNRQFIAIASELLRKDEF